MHHNSQQSRRRVAELRAAHPGWTLAEIAGEVGVTRERVRQLLVALRLPTTGITIKYNAKWRRRQREEASNQAQ